MLCEECNERPATVFIAQIINGEVLNLTLCETCAAPLIETTSQHPSRINYPIPPARHLPGGASIPPDPQRPSVLHLSEKISVCDLATALRLRPFHVIELLMEINMFCRIEQEVDFSAAAHICSRCHVTARKVT